jgi:hypothetical protein
MSIVLGVLKWILAIAAVGGTVGLFTWLIVLFVRKDPRSDSTRNGH